VYAVALHDGGERARAISRRFAVPAQPGRDVWPSLWQWRLAAATPTN
jgi:hypothetical protein